MQSKLRYSAWGAALVALVLISCSANATEPAGAQNITAPSHEGDQVAPPPGDDQVAPPPGGDQDQPQASDIDCSEAPAVFCCQAMTPECQQCTANANAAMAAWEKQCKASPQ